MNEMGEDLVERTAELPEEWAAAVPRVEDLLRALASTVRSHRLYAGEGPALERFVSALVEKFTALWNEVDVLRLEVDEQSMTWEGRKVYPTGDASGELAFLFYKDGIRSLTFSPGFEEHVERLLWVLGSVPQARDNEDDLITLLWQENLGCFHYDYVEIAAESIDLDGSAGGRPSSVNASDVREQAALTTAGLSPEDFQETLYFLDEGELRTLREEVRKEANRDLWTDVLNGLFDRLEDGDPERQSRIIRILSELLPTMLGGREFKRSAALLREIAEMAGRPGQFPPPVLREIRGLFAQLADPATVTELVRTLEMVSHVGQSEHLSELLSFFPPEAIAPLTRAIAVVTRPDVKRVLETAVRNLVEANRDQVVMLLRDEDPSVVEGAVHWVGTLGIASATGDLTPLLGHAEASVRCAVANALAELNATEAGNAMIPLLTDADREVRIAGAHALSALQYAAACPALREIVESKRIRSADRTEKIAFFEAFGTLAAAEAVSPLDRILNTKNWLGRGESAEIRACAALGLARVRHPSAGAALAKAVRDGDPVVRSTVARALRETAA